MLDILKKHLEEAPFQCVVSVWISGLKEEEQSAFNLLITNRAKINIAVLYKDLALQEGLPFKVTVFRSHMKGYCTCQKN
jgi:hypothetical protein